MLYDFIRFEWLYHSRKLFFYVSLLVFLGVGLFIGLSESILFPNVFINSPYQITYLTGLFSLASIFTITLSVGQTFLREEDSKFNAIIYALPISKPKYLLSKIGIIIWIGWLSFSFWVAGLFLGHMFSSLPEEKIGAICVQHYLFAFTVVAIPNIILISSVVCTAAMLTKNRMIVFIAGLFIYIFYLVGSIFSNSPLIAGSTPPTPQELDLFAKLDPLGLGAFLEQTRYWTAEQRNQLWISLSGNFLFNRIFWLAVSAILLIMSYLKYDFRIQNPASSQKEKKSNDTYEDKRLTIPQKVSTSIHSWKHHWLIIFSYLRMDLRSILTSVPIILIFCLWTTFLGIELANAIDGNLQTGRNFATTGLMVSTILEVSPLFTLIILLFYSSDILWRSNSHNFSVIEQSTPVDATSILLSKIITLSIIPVILIAYSCLMGMIFQTINGFSVFDISLYLSPFYLAGLPLILNVILISAIHTFSNNKYTGIVISSVIVLLTNSNLGKLIGFGSPLLRYANSFSKGYNDMNGFGSYIEAFHWQMGMWVSFSVILIFVVTWITYKKGITKTILRSSLFITALLLFSICSGYVINQTILLHPKQSAKELNDWKQRYEEAYRKFDASINPTVKSVKAKVDLFTSKQQYEVQGEYQLVNNSIFPLDSILIYSSRLTQIHKINIPAARLLSHDSEYGHYWYFLEKPLLPGDELKMEFTFSSSWSPFQDHDSFNSIIANGTFLRISNYFPSFGYQDENEITSTIERKQRAMLTQKDLKSLEAIQPDPYHYEFIDLELIVSTEKNQTVVGVGEMIGQWKTDHRNFFHFKTRKEIPFRFALSSAQYQIVRDSISNIGIELYFDSRHGTNVTQLINDIKSTLSYCEQNFGDYPHSSIRFAEVSAFAGGFAATAYPGIVYMKENGGFYSQVREDADLVNQLASHELSHQWWGCSTLIPEIKEGSWVLTETLANYTELMLYAHKYGWYKARRLVQLHTDLYMSNRSFSKESPLYKTTYETPHLPYDKGLVAMYEIQNLLNEDSVNTALRSLIAKHAYPNNPPSSLDLIFELEKVASPYARTKIDELFRQIVVYDSKIISAKASRLDPPYYEVAFEVEVHKYLEDGFGRRKVLFPEEIDIAIFSEKGDSTIEAFVVKSNRINGKLKLRAIPNKIMADPQLKTIDVFPADNLILF